MKLRGFEFGDWLGSRKKGDIEGYGWVFRLRVGNVGVLFKWNERDRWGKKWRKSYF